MAKKKTGIPDDVIAAKNVDSLTDSIGSALGFDTVQQQEFENRPYIDLEGVNDLFNWAVCEGKGIPYGSILHMYGKEGAGKSALGHLIMAKAQQDGAKCILFDLESSVRGKSGINLLRNYGVKMLPSDCTNGEKPLVRPIKNLSLHNALQFCLYAANNLAESKSDERMVVMIDSVASKGDPDSIEDITPESFGGKTPKLLSQAFSLLAPKMNAANLIIILINQLRDNLGTTGGTQKQPPGGGAIRYYATFNVRIEAIEKIYRKTADSTEWRKDMTKSPIGAHVRLYAEKNRLTSPFRPAELAFAYGYGFNNVFSIIRSAKTYGIMKTSGRSLVFEEDKKTEMKWLADLSQDPMSFKKLRDAVIEHLSKAFSIENNFLAKTILGGDISEVSEDELTTEKITESDDEPEFDGLEEEEDSKITFEFEE